jgi:hypothetical protein
MMMQTEAKEVQLRYHFTRNFPRNDLFIEVDDLKGNPVAVFNGTDEAAKWLAANNFHYVQGSSGVWSRDKEGFIPGIFSNGLLGGRAMMWDGQALTNRAIYKRRSTFAVDHVTVCWTIGLCALVFALFVLP